MPGKFTPLRVSENIAAGDMQNNNQSNIERAARDADASSFIEKLPQQYRTKLRDERFGAPSSKTRLTVPMDPMMRGFRRAYPEDEPEDPSVDLSGGQWQRLALSRAFMRVPTADLLILDEPSSSLDPEAEHKLFCFIQQMRRNRTTIYVTHRFYTVRMATKIAFFEEGKLIEWGGHDELMKVEKGKYLVSGHVYAMHSRME